MGETPGAFYLRPIVIALLHYHFRKRLSLLRRRIALDTQFSEQAANGVLTKVDRAVDFWRRQKTLGSVVFGWILPLAAPLAALWKWISPESDFSAPWPLIVFGVGYTLIYALLVLGGAFTVKRGLMLGGTGYQVALPHLLPGCGGYEKEREIFGPMGLAITEFPLDVVVFILSFLVMLALNMAPEFAWALTNQNSANELYQNIGTFSVPFSIFATLVIALSVFVWIRRRKLGRA